eukprot:TRINITY_DN14720_c0_g1_i1.p1 TRINITY_DN14720_c0_g1~~TRINITY_DN14720_c0_g1_i1.p1  ORF type:complete len:221 (+),score=51.64 TRINITY_DN14720_c0_g1_i1:25-687(+)
MNKGEKGVKEGSSGAPPGFEDNPFDNEDLDLEKEYKLESSWTFWHDKCVAGSSAEEYEASLLSLCTLSTITEFWQCYNNLPSVDKLKPKTSFHLMKEGIKPIWEDPQNAEGGFWVFRVKDDNTPIVSVWKEILLAVIGEQFEGYIEQGDGICGVTVSLRSFHNELEGIFRVWTQSAAKKNERVVERLKQVMPNTDLGKPYYKSHADHPAFTKTPSTPQTH